METSRLKRLFHCIPLQNMRKSRHSKGGIMKRFGLIFAIFLMVPVLAHSEGTEIAASAMVQYGKSYPQGELAKFLDQGDAYRLNLFGGAKLKVPFISAVGLGFDFTYYNYISKNSVDGFYFRRYLWDMLFIPIGFGPFLFTPGLAWVITDTHLPQFGINQTSIRPAGTLGLGFFLGLADRLALRIDGRVVWEMDDHEKMNDGNELNIRGKYVEAFAGLQYTL